MDLDLATQLGNEAIIEAEIGRRTIKHGTLQTLNFSEYLSTRQIGLLNEGTIVTLVSRQGFDYLDGLVDAIKTKSESRTRIFCEAIAQLIRGDLLKRKEPVDLRKVPLIVDVMYGNSWLAKHLLITPDVQVAFSAAVWSGGKLDSRNFRLLQHVKRGSKPTEIQVLTILIPPKLTKIERAMVAAVPEDISDVHVKGPSVAWTAAGIDVRWDQPVIEMKQGLSVAPSREFLVPFYEQQQIYTTVEQQQLQQNDTKQQQQQQQQADTKQQQQQQQQETQQQQQQQQQFDNKQQVQQQQQQNQNKDGQQQQRQRQAQHDAATQKAQQGSMYWNEMDGGLVIRQFDQERYASLLERIDFSTMDATQSVRELLRLREQLITAGMS